MSHQHRDPYTPNLHYQRAWENYNKRMDKIHASNPRLVERYADLNDDYNYKWLMRSQTYGDSIGNINFDGAGFKSFTDIEMHPLLKTIQLVKVMMDCSHEKSLTIDGNIYCLECGAVDSGLGWDLPVSHELSIADSIEDIPFKK